MATIKTLKFKKGQVTETDPSQDAIAVKSVVFGGAGGTELDKPQVDTLVGGRSAEASSLHQHDSIYYQKSEAIAETTGSADANRPVKTNSQGVIDSSLLPDRASSQRMEVRVVTQQEVAAKALVLSDAPISRVKIYPDGGIPLIEGINFTKIEPNTISWAGYEIETILEAEDEMVIEYFI